MSICAGLGVGAQDYPKESYIVPRVFLAFLGVLAALSLWFFSPSYHKDYRGRGTILDARTGHCVKLTVTVT